MSARDPIPFRFEKHDIRVVHIDGEPHLAGKDVCDALGYADHTNAMKQHCKGVVKRHPLLTSGGMQELRILAESDVLRLIVSSALPSAEAFERWLFEDVLPSIRRTGNYSVPTRVLSPAEMFLQNAQMMVDLEQRQLAQDEKIDRVEQRIEEIADTQLLTECPSNAESITTIRARINQKYGLPAWVIDQVVAQMPYSPKPAGTVLNGHESAKGSKYRIYWIRDISMIFERFVGESERTTPHRARHSFVEHEFKLAPGYGRDG